MANKCRFDMLFLVIFHSYSCNTFRVGCADVIAWRWSGNNCSVSPPSTMSQEVSGSYAFRDGLQYDETNGDWTYCTPKDRRFFKEYEEGIQPAGQWCIIAT